MPESVSYIESATFLAMVVLFTALEQRFALARGTESWRAPRHFAAALWSLLGHAGLRGILFLFIAVPSGGLRWGRLALGIVLVDFGLYVGHRAMHTRRLWRMHRLHHSTKDLAWLSGFRGSMTHAFVHVGVQVGVFALLQLNVSEILCGFLFAVVFQFWAHANLRWDLGPLRFVVTTPQNHRVHHSSEPHFFDKNFGEVTMLWDHLFGTFADPRLDPTTPVGLSESAPLTPRDWLGI